MADGETNSADQANVVASGGADTSGHDTASFEEFKLYFDSIEKVTDRRLAMNKFNYSVSVAAVVAIAAVANLAATTAALRLVSLILIGVASALAVLFCMYWVKQIDDAKQLNAAKFRVLSEMANRVVFDSADSQSRARSFHPFDREWLYLKDALTEAGPARRLKVLEGSRAEYFVPRGFSAMFASILLAVILVGAMNFNRIVHDASFEVRPQPEPTSTSSPR